MEEKLEGKDLEANVSFAFVLNGHIGDFFKLRHFIVEQVKQSRVVYQTFSRNPLFLVGWNDLTEEKKSKMKEVKEVKKNEQKDKEPEKRRIPKR
jgi:hypothetical protein